MMCLFCKLVNFFFMAISISLISSRTQYVSTYSLSQDWLTLADVCDIFIDTTGDYLLYPLCII